MIQPKYRTTLPQKNSLFLTDGGLETVMVFQNGIELPCFAAIDLLRTANGAKLLAEYFEPYCEIARNAGAGLIVETATWRASPDWAEPIGFTNLNELADANILAARSAFEIRTKFETPQMPVVVSGCIGPRGDGYSPDTTMTISEAANYHSWQIGILARSGVDLITAITMPTIEEATGIALAAKNAKVPAAISFTVETNGRLPTGETLEEAIHAVDEATNRSSEYYMINCAHPTHFAETLDNAGAWVGRIKGIRANASTRSHAELDCACDLDAGDPVQLGREMADLKTRFPHLTVLGGCCGTDHRHIAEIAAATAASQSQAAE
ncbi:MAG: homocysteine S-methyltransferase family protein [Filomicrobium sp.]